MEKALKFFDEWLHKHFKEGDAIAITTSESIFVASSAPQEIEKEA